MSRRIACPFPEYDDVTRDGEPVYYLDLPDAWLGLHAVRRDAVIEQTDGKGLGDTLRTFMISLALCDGWNLPDLSMQDVKDGNVKPVSLELIAWANAVVQRSYTAAANVPKGLPAPLSVLARIAAREAQESTDGDSDATA